MSKTPEQVSQEYKDLPEKNKEEVCRLIDEKKSRSDRADSSAQGEMNAPFVRL